MQNTDKTPFERVQTARHPERPYTLDIIEQVFTDFLEIHGDRRFADDPAIICGFAKLGQIEVAVIGQQKGRDTNERRHRNFAMPKPEGYRKALRMMKMAEKFGQPLITIVDTPGAYPGIDAEERGQAEAIAFNLREMASLKIPTVTVVLGEGGSGGALGIAVADCVIMLENAVYSVISPEGCAAILWKDAAHADLAAENLRLTARDLMNHRLIDEIIGEPQLWTTSEAEAGGEVNRRTFEQLRTRLAVNIGGLSRQDSADRIKRRYEKFRAMGVYETRKPLSNSL